MVKIEVDNLCNQCRELDFGTPGCKKVNKGDGRGEVTRLVPSAYVNADGFIHVIKPSWCPGKVSFKAKPKVKE